MTMSQFIYRKKKKTKRKEKKKEGRVRKFRKRQPKVKALTEKRARSDAREKINPPENWQSTINIQSESRSHHRLHSPVRTVYRRNLDFLFYKNDRDIIGHQREKGKKEKDQKSLQKESSGARSGPWKGIIHQRVPPRMPSRDMHVRSRPSEARGTSRGLVRSPVSSTKGQREI